MESNKLRSSLLKVKLNEVIPFKVAKHLVEEGMAKNNGDFLEIDNPKSWYPLEITQKGRDVLWPDHK